MSEPVARSTDPPPPLVSILIVNYRTYAELEACLASLQECLETDVETIVVDHASERDAAERLARRFQWIRVVPVAGNPGFAAGVNRAASAASGRFLLLLNPDCTVTGDIAHPLARWLDEHPHVGACGVRVREPDGSVQASARRFPDWTTGLAGRTSWLSRAWPDNPWTRRNLGASGTAAPAEVDWVTGACMMVRRDAFESVGGMDEAFFMYWEDADFCLRLKRAGWLTVYYPALEVTHLTGRSSAHVPTASLVAFHRSAFRYFRKHGGRAAACFAPCVFVALQARLLARLASRGLSRLAGPGSPPRL